MIPCVLGTPVYVFTKCILYFHKILIAIKTHVVLLCVSISYRLMSSLMQKSYDFYVYKIYCAYIFLEPLPAF